MVKGIENIVKNIMYIIKSNIDINEFNIQKININTKSEYHKVNIIINQNKKKII